MGSQNEFSPYGCLFVFLILFLLRTLGSEASVSLIGIVLGIAAIVIAGSFFYRLAQYAASRFGNEDLALAIVFGALVGTPLVLVLVYIIYEGCVSAAEALCDGFGKLVAWHGGIVVVFTVGVLIVGGILWGVFAISNAVSKKNQNSDDDGEETPETSLLWNRVGDEITIVGLNGEASELRLPDAISGAPVTSIRNGAWNQGSPTGAFAECDTLTKVVLPSGLKLLGSYAFKGCDYLSGVVLPRGLKEIGYGAFYGCGNLERVRLPEGLELLHGGAFCNCASLERIGVPSGVDVVEKSAFEGCVNLRRVELSEGVKELGESAFSSCASLTDVVMPSTLRNVGRLAFRGCVGLDDVELPEGLEKIGAGAFYGCSELLEVTLPSTLNAIGDAAFPATTRFNVYVDTPGERWVKRMGRPFTLITDAPVRKAPKAELASSALPVALEQTSAFVRARRVARRRSAQNCSTYYLNATGPVPSVFLVPESVDGAPVVRVGEAAFKNNLYVSSVIIPFGVTRIENHAFCGCSRLEQAFIPESVAVIGARAFDECNRLRTVLIPRSVIQIDRHAFGPSTCLCVFAGSYAAGWAKEHGQPTRFVAEKKKRAPKKSKTNA